MIYLTKEFGKDSKVVRFGWEDGSCTWNEQSICGPGIIQWSC